MLKILMQLDERAERLDNLYKPIFSEVYICVFYSTEDKWQISARLDHDTVYPLAGGIQTIDLLAALDYEETRPIEERKLIVARLIGMQSS